MHKDSQLVAPACSSEKELTLSEKCTITLTSAGTYYVDVYGFQATNYVISASLDSAIPVDTGGGGGGGGGSMNSTFLALLGLLAALHATRKRRNRVTL